MSLFTAVIALGYLAFVVLAAPEIVNHLESSNSFVQRLSLVVLAIVSQSTVFAVYFFTAQFKFICLTGLDAIHERNRRNGSSHEVPLGSFRVAQDDLVNMKRYLTQHQKVKILTFNRRLLTIDEGTTYSEIQENPANIQTGDK